MDSRWVEVGCDIMNRNGVNYNQSVVNDNRVNIHSDIHVTNEMLVGPNWKQDILSHCKRNQDM